MIYIQCYDLTKKKHWKFKDGFSRLRKFLATESPLKMMKNAFCFILKALFVFKIFNFLSSPFGHVEKRLDQKDYFNRLKTTLTDF